MQIAITSMNTTSIQLYFVFLLQDQFYMLNPSQTIRQKYTPNRAIFQLKNNLDVIHSSYKKYSPRSVLGPASSCLNLSNRDASLSVNAGVTEALQSAIPLTKGGMQVCGRDCDLCMEEPSLALSEKKKPQNS